MVQSREIPELSVGELFSEDTKYLIPIYQRNYAWSKKEVEQLVMDISDYANKYDDSHYFIGTLVVYEKEINHEKVFETIDGQQRLTTLSILLSALKNEFDEMKFTFKHLLVYESREVSTNTLNHIYNRTVEKKEDMNPTMKNAYTTIINYLKNSAIEIEKFKNYLLGNVKILRVSVPKDTDLNHYFEIMNNRGEQLEKHEILKARMLKELDGSDKRLFNHIWETCSDMYRYVQYGFTTEQRDKMFGREWNRFMYKEFDSIKNILYPSDDRDDSNKKIFGIDDILKPDFSFEKAESTKSDIIFDRFTSPINFSNFLLHVLKVTQIQNGLVPLDKLASLDDKRLLDSFDHCDKEFVKQFGFNLLKMRFLLDNYIIKREYSADKDEWSLKQLYKYSNKKDDQQNIQYKNRFESKNRKLLMLLSMFHVSNPSQSYKYWLTGALDYLYENYTQDGIVVDNYIEYLEKLAEKFFKNRYLAKKPNEFDEIIFKDIEINQELDCEKLDKGTSVEHFIFNYLDYLLWKYNTKTNKFNFDYFSFSFSNSVEHFYPQNPIEGHQKIDNIDDFGNLCLISVSKNAKLNNHPPSSKLAYYPNNEYDTLKQHCMMEQAKNWDINAIKNHKEEMLKVLQANK